MLFRGLGYSPGNGLGNVGPLRIEVKIRDFLKI